MKEYRMLIEFPKNLYRIYFPLRSDKIIPELSKLLRISNLEKVLGKNDTSLKWRMLEIELEKKSGSREIDCLGHFWPSVVPKPNGCNDFEGHYCLCRV
jgi:hypothetical protein